MKVIFIPLLYNEGNIYPKETNFFKLVFSEQIFPKTHGLPESIYTLSKYTFTNLCFKSHLTSTCT